MRENRFRVPQSALVSQDLAILPSHTPRGGWLRSHNSVVRVGDFLFVHAGYSPELDTLALERDEINQRIRDTIGPPAWPECNGVKHIVIGHTVAEDIGWLDAKKHVLGIDVKWSKPGEGEGLLVEDGVLHAVDMTGKKRTIEVVQP
jgi:hypothetical protein